MSPMMVLLLNGLELFTFDVNMIEPVILAGGEMPVWVRFVESVGKPMAVVVRAVITPQAAYEAGGRITEKDEPVVSLAVGDACRKVLDAR